VLHWQQLVKLAEPELARLDVCKRPVSDHLFVGGARQKGRLGVRSFISRYHHWARDSTTEVNVETNGGIT